MLVDRERIAAALPAYDLGAELGAGGYGLVLAAHHRGLDRPAAVKILNASQDTAAAGFRTEARVLALLDHPHVVRVYDYIEDGGLRLIVMELLAGGTLTRQYAGGMAGEAACAVAVEVAEALAYAHSRGVLHRDLKPSNLLFSAAGILKVTDFGIAKLFQGADASASAPVGTPGYMAPEQITGQRLSPAADLYSLGAVLYELLSGAPPFSRAQSVFQLYQEHLYRPPPTPAGVPEPVAGVVLRALAKDPAARQPDAQAFAADLARAAADAYGPGPAAWPGTSPADHGDQLGTGGLADAAKHPAARAAPRLGDVTGGYLVADAPPDGTPAAASMEVDLLPGPRPATRPDGLSTDRPGTPGGRDRSDGVGPRTSRRWLVFTAGAVAIALIITAVALAYGSGGGSNSAAGIPSPRPSSASPRLSPPPGPTCAAGASTAPPPASVPPPPTGTGPAAAASWRIILTNLYALRDNAFNCDVEADLARAYAPGSSAYATDLDRLRQIQANQARADGLHVRIQSVTVVSATAGSVVLRVVDVLPAYRYVKLADGALLQTQPARAAKSWTVTLLGSGHSYRMATFAAAN